MDDIIKRILEENKGDDLQPEADGGPDEEKGEASEEQDEAKGEEGAESEEEDEAKGEDGAESGEEDEASGEVSSEEPPDRPRKRSRSPHSQPPRRTKKPKPEDILNFPYLESFARSPTAFLDPGLAFQGPPSPSYVDSEVLQHSRKDFEAFLSRVSSLAQSVQWQQTAKAAGRRSGPFGEWPEVTCTWEDAAGTKQSRLLLWSSGREGFIALRVLRDWALVSGCLGGHPFVICNELDFGNSDGSSAFLYKPEGEPGTDPTPERVVSALIQMTDSYLFHQRH
eukprot:TRINITY_DN20897_c0_g1_i1.p1 TRINITY_DN20897_c0_g1~~TRINITY_DN20897_c0_g1_i1.p1  ORF type:complete len:289 (+),score=30.53 TRINITY_DN20897_c0_g1_i1:26-868(+)